MKRWNSAPTLFVLLLFGLAAPALAQGSQAKGPSLGYNGWGVRVGVSQGPSLEGDFDPDQIYGGVHFELGEFARDVRFRPVLEVGFGDDVTLLQAIADVHYVFSKVQVWKPYVGGGVGLTFVKLNDAPSGVDDTDNEIGLMGVGGIETKLKSATKFFLEVRVGLGDDDPDLKLGAGWSWK
jgi:hypothetical protein